MKITPFYNVQHSPIGAFASFTLGFPGAKGGLGLELKQPANEAVYIGVEAAKSNDFDFLPFFSDSIDPTQLFDQNAKKQKATSSLRCFSEKQITRSLQLTSDTWQAGDLTFKIFSPYGKVPEPSPKNDKELQQAVLPALVAELTIDNRKGKKARRAFFGYKGEDIHSNMRTATLPGKQGVGVAHGNRTGIFSNDPKVQFKQAFTIEEILQPPANAENDSNGLGQVGVLTFTIPARKIAKIYFAICFYRGDRILTEIPSRYYYTRYFDSIESVAQKALPLIPALIRKSEKADLTLSKSKLSLEQQWMVAQSVHSYYGSTQFLEADGKPFWIVNEGEYRMINTFDLTVDQVFFELKHHPWTVRNELDWYRDRYSYRDQVRFPGDKKLYPGGISFTHDMGVANSLSHIGKSSYERGGLHGCFSYMTHEELVNWLLCALLYVKQTKDHAWAKKNLRTFQECFQSMIQRDHPVAARRNGVMKLDSSRCLQGAEITTYDSLDVSLGQARNNLYLAVKCWATYVGLDWYFETYGTSKLSAEARLQAERGAFTVAHSLRPDGTVPAILEDSPISHILPAIEGLAFPYIMGLDKALHKKGPYGSLIQTLESHIQNVFKVGICLFKDGGIKLSSTSDNSWLSKVYLIQFILRKILVYPNGKIMEQADKTHLKWLLHPEESYWAWSDQMILGVARGSKYYPRGVTSILWLDE